MLNEIEQQDSDMSFFMGSPASESTNNAFDETKNEKDIEVAEGFNEMLLDPDDFIFNKPSDINANSTMVSQPKILKQPPKILSKNSRIRNLSDDEEDAEDLEIVEIQEKQNSDELSNFQSPALFSKNISAVRARTMTNRPTKIRRTSLNSVPKSSFTDTDQLVEKQLIAALNTQRSEIQRLQTHLNSYISKYEETEFKLSNTLKSLKELQKKVNSNKLLQAEMGKDFLKLSEIKTGYGNQIAALISEKEELQEQLKALKTNISDLEATHSKLSEKIRTVSHENEYSKS